MPLKLDYFYGGEAEQYSFYRIPKVLFTDQNYSTMTMEARVLYGLLLDRMGLSARNGWLDTFASFSRPTASASSPSTMTLTRRTNTAATISLSASRTSSTIPTAGIFPSRRAPP